MCFPLSVENLGHIGAIKLGSTAEVLALTPRRITKTLCWSERHFFSFLFFHLFFPSLFLGAGSMFSPCISQDGMARGCRGAQKVVVCLGHGAQLLLLFTEVLQA